MDPKDDHDSYVIRCFEGDEDFDSPELGRKCYINPEIQGLFVEDVIQKWNTRF